MASAAVLVLVIAAVVVFARGPETRPHLAVRDPPALTTTTTTPARDAGPFGIATMTGTELAVYPQPAATGAPIITLEGVTAYGLPTTLAVDAREAPVEGWVPVLVPFYKPNATTGWVQASGVALSETRYLVKVSLGQHELTLLNGGEPVLESTVIIGTPSTPTPLGRFYVTDPLNCNTVTLPAYPLARCAGAYGAFAIGTSGLSEALDSFQGTIPQIALHGTNLPVTELGKDLSNGCVRMPNAIVLELAKVIPLGTPVEITA